MRKYEELNNSNSCLQKADDDEMLFILRAQDVTSPKVVLLWIAENIDHLSNSKAREAFNCALTMRQHKGRRVAN